MHSTLVRVQNVFGFFTTVVFCVGGLIALTALVAPSTPSAKLELRNVQVYVSNIPSAQEQEKNYENQARKQSHRSKSEVREKRQIANPKNITE